MIIGGALKCLTFEEKLQYDLKNQTSFPTLVPVFFRASPVPSNISESQFIPNLLRVSKHKERLPRADVTA